MPPEPADRWDESASDELLLLLLVHAVEDVVDLSLRPRGLEGLVVGLDVHIGFAVIVGRSELLEVISTYPVLIWRCRCIFAPSLVLAFALLKPDRWLMMSRSDDFSLEERRWPLPVDAIDAAFGDGVEEEGRRRRSEASSFFNNE